MITKIKYDSTLLFQEIVTLYSRFSDHITGKLACPFGTHSVTILNIFAYRSYQRAAAAGYYYADTAM